MEDPTTVQAAADAVAGSSPQGDAGAAAVVRASVPSLSELSADARADALASIVDAVPEIIWYKDVHNNILWANRAALARSGRTAAELLGRNCFELSPREGSEYFQEDLRVMESGQPMVGIVHYFRRANGERRWVVTDKYPSFGRDGSVIGIVAITRDMPENAVAQSRIEHLRLPRELMHLDTTGAATFVSEGSCRILGLDRSAALGSGWLSVLHPEDVPLLRREWAKAVKDRRPVVHVHLRVLQSEGMRPQPLDLRAVPELDESGAVVGFLASVSEDTSTSEDAAADEEQRRLLDAMATTAPVGMFVSDIEGHCSYVNDRWCRIWGVERAQARAVGWIDAIHPDERERVIDDLLRSVREKRPYSGEFRVRHRDGNERWVLTRSVPLLDSAGEVVALVGTGTDITSRKHAEEEIGRLNRDLEARVAARTAELEAAIRELEAFCYAVSHDLRAPLRSLDGFSHALLEEFGDRLDETGADWLRRLRGGSQRMGRLIDDLLTLSRLGRGTMRREELDLSEVARDVAEELRHTERGRNVAVEIESGCTCVGDPALLRVVIENLLGNAWKFTSRTEDARVRFGSEPDEDGRRVFFVADNGIGFDMQFGDKLFGMFQRLHHPSEYEGTGIGLANVRRIVERHGGRVWAQGQPGAGATFYFTL